jgi:hypothetical protein
VTDLPPDLPPENVVDIFARRPPPSLPIVVGETMDAGRSAAKVIGTVREMKLGRGALRWAPGPPDDEPSAA